MENTRGAKRGQKPFDIKERTFQFAVTIIHLANQLPSTIAGREIARQLIRAGTSVGSNMQAADAAVSKRDFINDVRISRKEARETHYWLSIIRGVGLLQKAEVGLLIDESWELVRVLSAIIRSATAHRPTES